MTRKQALALLMVSAIAAGVGWVVIADWSGGESGEDGRANPESLSRPFLDAIREGDHAAVKRLLDRGANPNVRDEDGDTALMRAALSSDAGMMRLLLEHGADVRQSGLDGTAPLHRAIHDVEKIRLLLDRGAAVDDVAMLAAAGVANSRRALELLVARGGRGRAGEPRYSALMAAAGAGDREAVAFLLEHGADARATTPTGFTPLIAAALSGSAEVVALLLARGANPNAVCTLERGILQTPAGVAASMGHAECLRLLMAAGAEVNVQGGPFQHTPLLGAATTGSEETVRLLLGKADLRAADWNGQTALEWAERSGETLIVKRLRAAGAEPRPPAVAESRPPAAAVGLRQAVAKALPLLQKSQQKITETRNCVSCHQHPLVAMAAGPARKRGFTLDEGIAEAERQHIRDDIRGRVRPLLLGTGIDPTLAPHVLAGMAAEDEPAGRLTDALVHFLVLRQRGDGHWHQENCRPPDEASHFQFTTLAVRGLQAYAARGRREEVAGRVALARRWLANTPPKDTTDVAFQLLGLGWAEADPSARDIPMRRLLAEQREDGGWSQLPTMGSDAYATGLALTALHGGGGLSPDHPAYRRGVGFLLSTQRPDGSWFVATRSFPIVEYSGSGFPHGTSQFISASATCWAVMALCAAEPERK